MRAAGERLEVAVPERTTVQRIEAGGCAPAQVLSRPRASRWAECPVRAGLLKWPRSANFAVIMNQQKNAPTVEEQAAELESLILSNGLMLARGGGLNQESLPGLDRALELLKIRRRRTRRRSESTANSQTVPTGASLAQVIAETRMRHGQLGATAGVSKVATPDSGIVGMPVHGESPIAETERRAA